MVFQAWWIVTWGSSLGSGQFPKFEIYRSEFGKLCTGISYAPYSFKVRIRVRVRIRIRLELGLELKISGVATGWHGWTMSRGPGAKGAPRERQIKKKMRKKKKEKEDKKRENWTFQIPRRSPHPIYLCRWMTENTKIKHWLSSQSFFIFSAWQKLQELLFSFFFLIFFLSHNFWNMRWTMGNWGPMYSFSACMSSKISQLKFGPISLKECNGAILNRLKIICGLGPPISLSGHQAPIFPLHHQRAPKCFIVPSRAQFPVSHKSFSPSPQCPHCFIKGFQFPHCIKAPRIFHCAIKGPHFLIMSSKWWPLISHHVIKWSQFIIASSRGPHCEFVSWNFPLHYQGVPIYHCVIKTPPFPPSISSSKGPKLPKYTMFITSEICTD